MPLHAQSSKRDAVAARPRCIATGATPDLFNVSYEILLQILERYFAHTEETDAQLGRWRTPPSR